MKYSGYRKLLCFDFEKQSSAQPYCLLCAFSSREESEERETDARKQRFFLRVALPIRETLELHWHKKSKAVLPNGIYVMQFTFNFTF